MAPGVEHDRSGGEIGGPNGAAAPFAATQLLSRSQGHDRIDDPYTGWRALRQQAPVQKLDLMAAAGLGSDADYRGVGGLVDVYTVFSYDIAAQILRDNRRFHMAHPWPGEDLPRIGRISEAIGRSFLDMDGPDHRRIRALLQEAFSPKSLQRWMADLVLPVINGRIDTFADRGRADLLREFTHVFPVAVITGILGLDDGFVEEFHVRAEALLGAMADWDAAVAASAWLEDHLATLLQERRRHPGGSDIVSLLLAAEVDGDRLSDEEIYPFLKLLLPAGADTTFRGTSNLLFALLHDPAQLDEARRHRELVPGAVEESLRWEPPITVEPKSTVEDVVLGGVAIPAGSVVTVCIGAANRDESAFVDPERYDIHRPRTPPHLTFGGGPHICLGQHLARMEMVAAANALFDRLPGLRWDPDAPEERVSGFSFRAPAALPVVFD